MIDSILDGGADLIITFQGMGDWMQAPMKFFTFLGTEEFYLLVMPAIYWCVSAALGLRVGIVLLLSGGLNTILKWAFHLPRPYWYRAEVQGWSAEASFGVPSGHSQIPASVWGVIAAKVKRPWFWIMTIALVFLIGFSRMYLGVHFPHDVLVGWTLGILVVWVFLRLEAPVERWFQGRSLGNQVLAVFAVSIVILLIGALTMLAVGDFELPAEWETNAYADQPKTEDTALDPLNFANLVTNAAAFFGLAAGAILIAPRGGFNASGTAVQKLLRYLIGLVGVVVFWRGLGAVFPDEPLLLGYVLRYIRYTLIGLWISALAPMIFIRFGLAEKETE